MTSISQNQEHNNVNTTRDTVFERLEDSTTSTGYADSPSASQVVARRDHDVNTKATDTVRAEFKPVSTGCAYLPGASPAVIRMRKTAIAIVAIQAISLAAYGFKYWGQWVISITGSIMALALLSKPNKFCHSFAAIVFFVCGVLDLILALLWILVVFYIYDVGGTLPSDRPDDVFITALFIARGVVSALASLTMFLGSIFAIIAVVVWDRHGDPDPSNSV